MTKTGSTKTEVSQTTAGFTFGLLSFCIWGVSPFYFKLVGSIPEWEVLAQRVLWSFAFVVLLLMGGRSWTLLARQIKEMYAQPKVVGLLLISSLLITGNWWLLVWAVNVERVVEVSLGYYINPLFNVFLGMVLFGERFTRVQSIALMLAVIGVSLLVWQGGHVPWVALMLATSFSIYALVRKHVVIDSLLGLGMELSFTLPMALAYLFYIQQAGLGGIGEYGIVLDGLLIGLGVVTAVPLLLFSMAARRIRLSTLGLLQYLAPTISLFMAVFIWHEPFTATHAATFGLIWVGLLLYSGSAWYAQRTPKKNPIRD